MRIQIVTPAPPQSRSGNRRTAIRWASILRGLGHRVDIQENYFGDRRDLLIALHARRSARSVKQFRRCYPHRPLVLALTGTDLYHDLERSQTARLSVESASRLVVLQNKALKNLPDHWRDKTRVIYQSVPSIPKRMTSLKRVFEVCVLGHLRPVKDPFRAAMAARLLPASSRIRIIHCGAALSPAMRRRASSEMQRNTRYRWLGNLPQGQAIRRLARSRLMVLSSQMEGGANVVCESIATGVPILASRIPGSTGLLGDNYPGYFEFRDTRRLATLLKQAETDQDFYNTLCQRCRQRQYLVSPQREINAWSTLLRELST